MPTPADLRSGVQGLATLALHDLASLWPVVTKPGDARDMLAEALPLLLDKYGTAAASYASDWYDDLRDELDVPGGFTSEPASIGSAGTDELAGWAVTPLFGAEADWNAALSLAQGGLQRRVTNVARETLTIASFTDPRADGWTRFGEGECDWCVRHLNGEVRTVGYDFPSHDRCGCIAAPVFAGLPRDYLRAN